MWRPFDGSEDVGEGLLRPLKLPVAEDETTQREYQRGIFALDW
jgi:hypothetical protein